MKKIKITNKCYDKVEKVTLNPPQIVERSNDRAKDFVSKGFAEEVEEPKPKKTSKKK